MKKISLLLLLFVCIWNVSCESDSNTPANGYIETTEEGSSTFIFKGYTDATAGFNVFEAEGFDRPFYIQDKKFVGSAWRFATAASGPLSAMNEIPIDNAWKTDIEIIENMNFWARYNSTTKYVFVKIRIAYIQGNNVAIEYAIAGSQEFDLTNNENANSPIEGKSFVTDYSMPHLNPANYYVEHTVNYNNQDILNYAYEWIDSKKHTAWVAFSFDNTTSQQKFNRPDEEPWSTDPNLPEGMSPQESNHKNDGFDKGHICASADRLYDITANAQTFYYSNMSPQMTSFNGGYWITLEGLIQKWARSGEFEKMYVTKGGTMNELLVNFTGTQAAGDSKIPTTDANGFTKNGLACPKYYFIAVLAEKSGQYQSIGFLVEHRDDYGYSNSKQAPVSVVKQHSISIDELEQKTELDFFCNLPDIIENQVESSFNETDWNF